MATNTVTPPLADMIGRKMATCEVCLRVVRIPAWHVLRDADVVADYMRHLALHPEEIVSAGEVVSDLPRLAGEVDRRAR